MKPPGISQLAQISNEHVRVVGAESIQSQKKRRRMIRKKERMSQYGIKQEENG